MSLVSGVVGGMDVVEVEKFMNWVVVNIFMGKLGEVVDVVNGCLFFVLEEFKYMIGLEFVIDGGIIVY